MHELRVAPSILSADFARLADEVADVAPAVSMVHVDVMDAHYVPNLTLGPPVVRSLRAATPLFLDAHLMITDPRTYAPQVVAAGADSVTFHPEVEDDPLGLVELLRDVGSQVGVAVRPHQPLSLVEELLESIDLLLVMTVQPGFGGQAFQPEVLPKIAEAVAARERLGARFRIEVDGGISPDTVGGTAAAGADTFVAGSAVFDHLDRPAAARAVLAAAEAGRREAADGGPSAAG
ncbi:ribulose-phosphate 3-epimerase [Egicoccus halophilus]|uniref:Ribulose-phosphate 3-epimerase n=1 Tax=Egicoccus halophilus TaxID=1670830 RepID=A0A8J3ABH2_9ACTN|nr:ribulose-phosphate 3-epimerase [Egicoccus halophilus]GGI07456.1 ribulose-phosphate 3-epimerase [Egicoccus halophilus]